MQEGLLLRGGGGYAENLRLRVLSGEYLENHFFNY